MTRWMVLLLVLGLAGVGGCASAPAARGRESAVAKIGAFQGEYRFLSNFWPATVKFEGLTYPTVEHAYQSAKTLDMGERRRIAGLATPAEAKRAGEALVLRADWAGIKYEVMLRCVRYKFTHHAELGKLLLGTGDAYLEEGNTWGMWCGGCIRGEGRIGWGGF
ncbi:MAG TPA: NADAR family protein [Phycisphaerae bacterium]|nr:NADAR family protein [Phycisphaerae bacterium]